MSTIFPHPVLHSNTLDYCNPQSYRATIQRKSKTILEVQHHLVKDTLVASMVAKGEASFYCTVSIGGTAFRRTEPIAGNCQGECITACQEIELPAFKKRPEIFANAGVVNHEMASIPWDEATGVDDFHQIDNLQFADHALLAHSGWMRFFPMDALFQIRSDKDMRLGEFRPETSYANSTIHITIFMAPKLFDVVESNPSSAARAHVLCASIIPTLKDLQAICEKQNDGGLDETESTYLDAAEGLRNYLQARKIPVWGEEGFDPVEVASKFKPAMLDDYGMEIS